MEQRMEQEVLENTERQDWIQRRSVIGPRDIQVNGNTPKIKIDVKKKPELEGSLIESAGIQLGSMNSIEKVQVRMVKEEMDIEMDLEEGLSASSGVQGQQNGSATGDQETLREDQTQCTRCSEEITRLKKLLLEKNAENEHLRNLLEQSKQVSASIGTSGFENVSLVATSTTDTTQLTPCSASDSRHRQTRNQFVSSEDNDSNVITPEMTDFYEVTGNDLDSLLTELGAGYKSYNCFICGATFANKSSLSNHKRIHYKQTDDPDRSRCDICHKTFTKKFNLKRHAIAIHQNSIFECIFCGAIFSRVDNLNAHLKVHIGESPGQDSGIQPTKNQACVFCNKAFGGNEVLNRHYRTHTKEKPFWCTICSKQFSREWRCSEHYKKCSTSFE